MRPWKMKLYVPKSSRTNKEYLEILKLVVAEIDRQDKKEDSKDGL